MKKSTIIAAILAAAFAIPAAAQTNWTGFHAGVNIGHSSGGVDETPDYGLAHQSMSGNVFGAQLGYDYQFPGTKLVLGLETDLQKSSASGNRFTNFCTGCTGGYSDASTTKTQLDWFGTTRIRAGYAVGKFLPYVTGGIAYGRVKTSMNETYTDPYFGSSSWHNENTQAGLGYAVGAGVEWAAMRNMSIRAEYLRTRFEVSKQVNSYSSSELGLTNNIVRLGVNYRF